MKSIILKSFMGLSAAFIIAGTVTAQSENTLKRFELGLRYMPSFSKLDLQSGDGNVIKGSVAINQGFGAMMAFNISKNIGIQAEIDYSRISQKFEDRKYNRIVRINYIDIPLLFSLNTDKTRRFNLNVVAGPQYGFKIGSSINASGTESTDTLHAVVSVKQGDFGFAYGAGVEISANEKRTVRFDLGFRGFYGLVKLDGNNNSPNTYNVILNTRRKSIGGYIGVAFLF